MLVREADTAERERWNTFVADSPVGHIYQTWEWADLECERGWTLTRLVCEHQSTWQAVCCVQERRVPLLSRPVLYVRRGPVWAGGAELALRDVARALADIARARHAVFARISPSIADGGPARSLLEEAGYARAHWQVLHGATQLVDLQHDDESLLAQMETRTRSAIRKAGRSGVAVQSGTDAQSLGVFYRLYSELAARRHFRPEPLRYFTAVLEHLQATSGACVFVATLDGTALSAAFVLRFGHNCWYRWGASSTQRRQVNASEALQWGIMRWARDGGCRTYDLWGVFPRVARSHPYWGIHLFKRGFGGRTVDLIGEWDCVCDPLWYRLHNMLLPLYLRWHNGTRLDLAAPLPRQAETHGRQ